MVCNGFGPCLRIIELGLDISAVGSREVSGWTVFWLGCGILTASVYRRDVHSTVAFQIEAHLRLKEEPHFLHISLKTHLM